MLFIPGEIHVHQVSLYPSVWKCMKMIVVGSNIRKAAALSGMLWMLMSCQMNDECFDGPCSEIPGQERIDIQINGDIDLSVNLSGGYSIRAEQSPAGGRALVELDLGDANLFILQLVHDGDINLFDDTDMPYNIYPQAVEEDKTQFAAAEVKAGDDHLATYSTHMAGFPAVPMIDVVRIMYSDGEWSDFVFATSNCASKQIVHRGFGSMALSL